MTQSCEAVVHDSESCVPIMHHVGNVRICFHLMRKLLSHMHYIGACLEVVYACGVHLESGAATVTRTRVYSGDITVQTIYISHFTRRCLATPVHN